MIYASLSRSIIFCLESSFVDGGVGGCSGGIAVVHLGADVLSRLLLGLGGSGGLLVAAPSAAAATAASVLLHGVLPNGERRRGGRRGNERRGRRRFDCRGSGGRPNRISWVVLERSQVLRRVRLL